METNFPWVTRNTGAKWHSSDTMNSTSLLKGWPDNTVANPLPDGVSCLDLVFPRLNFSFKFLYFDMKRKLILPDVMKEMLKGNDWGNRMLSKTSFRQNNLEFKAVF